jgi:glyoxylase-like metal-dependent hydrolase (beta-lactamase superfamily II)
MQTRCLALLFLGSTLLGCGGASQPPPDPEAPSVVVTPPPPEPAAPKLSLSVLTGSPEGFLVTSTLISGEKEAVLIDAQFTLADAKKVAEAVTASGKKLTTVYVTHSHPDHYFGLPVIKEAFPEAKLVALPATIAEIEKTWEKKVAQWKPPYKDGITDKPIIPEPLAGTSIDLEGEKIEIVGAKQGDDAQNSYVWIPSLSTVIAGDIVYDAVFPWTAETTPEQRKTWQSTLDEITALGAKTVVPGHQKPEQKQEPANLTFTRDYLTAYDEALASSKTAPELQSKVKAKYPDAALDVILKLGSEASLKPAGKTAKK